MTNVCPPKPTTFFLPNFSEKKKVHLHSPHNIMSCEMRTVNYHLHESKYGLRFQMGEYYSLAQDCSLSLNVCIIPPSPSSSSDEGAANFAGYRDFCRLLKFSPISQQWHVLPKIFVFWFFASNPDDEPDQDLTGGKVGKSTNLQHSKVAIPSSRCHYCLLWNIDNCNFIYDDRILKIGNRFSLHFSQVILISWPTSSLTQCRTQCRTQWPTKTDQACQQHCQLSSANMFFSCPSSSRLGCTKNSKKFSKPHGLLVYFVATWV